MNINELNDYQLGFAKGLTAARNGENEFDVLENEPNLEAKRGIKEAYKKVLCRTFGDSLHKLKKLKKTCSNVLEITDAALDVLAISAIIDEEASRINIYEDKDGNPYVGEYYDSDSIDQAKARLEEDKSLEIREEQEDGSIILARKGNNIQDAKDDAEYSLKKINNKHYEVLKNGEHAYDLEQKKTNWTCSCTGFKYRGTCKHMALLKDILPKRHPRSEMEQFMPEIEKVFEGFAHWEIVGSWRRKKKDFKDIDVLVECTVSEFRKVLDRLQEDPNYQPIVDGNDIIRGMYHGFYFDVNRVIPGEWGSQLLYRTGSAQFNVMMRGKAKALGYALNEHGLFNRETGELIANESEEAIFNALGMKYVEPEAREY